MMSQLGPASKKSYKLRKKRNNYYYGSKIVARPGYIWRMAVLAICICYQRCEFTQIIDVLDHWLVDRNLAGDMIWI